MTRPTLRRRARQRGQAVVEFAVILPLFLTMVLSIAEFGVAFGTNMTLIEATREGARVGAVLGNGSGQNGCVGYSGPTNVDLQIVAAVQRVIQSPGSGVEIQKVDWIRIFNDTGSNLTSTNYDEWVALPTGGIPYNVCGVDLKFKANPAAQFWPATGRTGALPANSLGVAIQYKYRLFTPLGALVGAFGSGQITMIDSTVMDVEP